jgi:hypothetical protein
MGTRAQTPQDFAVGTSLMLITIIGTFAFIQGGAVTAFTDDVDGADQEAATRLAGVIIEEYSTAETSTTIKDSMYSDLENNFQTVKERAGLIVPGERHRNHQAMVMIVGSEDLGKTDITPAEDDDPTGGPAATVTLQWGDSYSGQSGAARAIRVIQLESDAGDDDPCIERQGGKTWQSACWLVVRVW